jgi:hypothetical protein
MADLSFAAQKERRAANDLKMTKSTTDNLLGSDGPYEEGSMFFAYHHYASQKTKMTTDALGNTLSVGDTVVLVEPKVYGKYHGLTTGIIKKITSCYFFVEITADHPHKGRVVPKKGDQLATY